MKLWDDKYQRFRQALKDLRIESGLKQQELADRLGKPQSYVSKYENGERGLDFLETLQICEAFGDGAYDKLLNAVQGKRKIN
ncbi:helix-turn-helix transcriptional regulator [Catenovulum sp. SM1970]|uniref:helix-turn-helix domain-containing protein n=1 Tax=Marinifaba aquimaris TaxID=2741323 RepID=UPI001571676E|nr:helix-turn-helix transcriptional regulator [Marinifaba aquimaris]NTS78696.1 helix-turn-helix transcriptional regulator [Marinifaba aquimaris]